MYYRIEIEPTETGFSAYSPDIPGVGVAAESLEEAKQMLHEAINLQYEDDVVIFPSFNSNVDHPIFTAVNTSDSAAAITSPPPLNNTVGAQDKVVEHA